MKRYLLAVTLALALSPAGSNAQFYNYNIRNTPFGQAYQLQVQNGPYSYAVEGYRRFPYPIASFGYSAYNFNNYPAFGAPYYPYPVYQQPSPIIVQQPIIIQQNNNPAANNPGAGNGFNGNNLLPAKRFGDGLAIPLDVKPAAKNDAPRVAVPKLGPAPQPAAKAPAAAPKPEMPRVAARPVGVDLAKKAGAAGKTAFAAGEYGRALELFRKAADLNPNDATTYYLLAQTQFAVGKYREAVASLSAGMTFKGDWSAAKFKPRDLYGKAAETFDRHIDELRAAVVQYPDDASLSFLLGHQLWFDDKPDQAKPHLTKAKAAGRGASPAELFLIPEA